MADFTLRQLELFSALPGFTTLGGAAKSLHISESALSHAVTELERAVGVQLCVRRKARGLQLTPAGQLFARRARDLLKQASELASAAAETEGRLRGPVNLGCYINLASSVLPSVLDQFAAVHPEVNIGLTVDTVEELLPRLLDGLLDTAIVYDTALPPGLDKHTIYQTQVMAVLPESHRLAAQKAVDLDDLAGEPLIALQGTPSAANTARIFEERGLTPCVAATVPVVELVRALVARGLGYSLLMSRPNYTDVTSEGLRVVSRPLTPPGEPSAVVAVWPTSMNLSSRAQALIEHAALCLSESARMSA